MKITCPCERVTLSLPDEKLPPAGRFLVGCPECGKRVRITRSPYGTEATFAETPVGTPEDVPAATTPGRAPETGQPETAPEALRLAAAPETPDGPDAPPERCITPAPIPPGRASAFLALTDGAFLTASKAFFRESGHYLRRAGTDMEEAAVDLRVNGHELCLIEDLPEFAPLLAETLAWPGDRRRETAVILLGEYEDFDVKSAFYKGVDAVLNKADSAEAADRLDTAVKNFRRRAKGRNPSP